MMVCDHEYDDDDKMMMVVFDHEYGYDNDDDGVFTEIKHYITIHFHSM